MDMYTAEERQRLVGHFFHFYQPERQGRIGPSARLPELGEGVRFQLLTGINYKIAMESYLPMFIRADMDAVLRQSNITFFASLRYWFEKAYPEGQLSGWSSLYDGLLEKIRSLEHREYHVLTGPPIHIILPLLPDADISMILRIARDIDARDFGFSPKGLFCPELAVDERVLRIATSLGFEYAILRDYQVGFHEPGHQGQDGSVSAHNNVCRVYFEDGSNINVVLADSRLSGLVAFDRGATINADVFLDSFTNNPDANKILAIDGETIGHHIENLDMFFARMHEVLTIRHLLPLEVHRLIAEPQKPQASVHPTSWSCAHGYGRWIGDCDCDNPSPHVRHNKKVFLTKLRFYNHRLNTELDDLSPGWREDFAHQFITHRKKILTGANYVSDLEEAFSDQTYFRLMVAKFATIVGFTSCGTYFAHNSQVEKRIPQAAIRAVELLYPLWRDAYFKENPDLYEKDEISGEGIWDTRNEFI